MQHRPARGCASAEPWPALRPSAECKQGNQPCDQHLARPGAFSACDSCVFPVWALTLSYNAQGPAKHCVSANMLFSASLRPRTACRTYAGQDGRRRPAPRQGDGSRECVGGCFDCTSQRWQCLCALPVPRRAARRQGALVHASGTRPAVPMVSARRIKHSYSGWPADAPRAGPRRARLPARQRCEHGRHRPGLQGRSLQQHRDACIERARARPGLLHPPTALLGTEQPAAVRAANLAPLRGCRAPRPL